MRDFVIIFMIYDINNSFIRIDELDEIFFRLKKKQKNNVQQKY